MFLESSKSKGRKPGLLPPAAASFCQSACVCPTQLRARAFAYLVLMTEKT